jgi:hypothetical protein
MTNKKYVLISVLILCIGFPFGWYLGGIISFEENVEKETVQVYIEPIIDPIDIPVKVSIYEPVVGQCDSTPFITADNSKIIKSSYYRWCAVSRDLMYYYLNFGDTIVLQTTNVDIPDRGHIDTLSIYLVVHDLMDIRYFNKVDMLVPEGAYNNMDKSELWYPFIMKKSKIVKIIDGKRK